MILRLILIFDICLVLGLGGFFGFRTYIINKADQQAEEILSGTSVSSAVALSLHATEKLYKSFGKHGYEHHQILGRIRPYVTNHRLPDFIQIPKGAIALATMEGWCDDAARALTYTLAHRHIDAYQWNMQGYDDAHSAALVDFGNGQTALLDPFYGYHTIKGSTPISPKDATKENALTPFDEKSNREFYKTFDERFMGIQGEPLTISMNIPKMYKPISLGEHNGDYVDARTALAQNGLGIVWEYIGHKYDRGWTRELVAQQPVQIDIILTRPANETILRTLMPAPEVNGTRLSWRLLKGSKIISQDGLAGISWTRLKSYIDVDQIIITPLGEQP